MFMVDLSEKETREQIIDPILERVGWRKDYVKEEINPVKSNFVTKEFNFDKDNIERGTDMFIDYLLLAEDNSPAAIIEAKRTSVTVKKGEIQGRTYRAEIEKQIGKKIPIFLTNGEKWYYIDEKDRRQGVPLPFNQEDLHRRAHQAEREKVKGEIPYYGACGIVDYVDNFIFNEEILLVGEDGQNLISRNKPMAFIVRGKSWVNNHAHVLKMKSEIDISFLRFYLNSIDYSNYITGSAQPKLNQGKLSKIKIPLPPLALQQKFASIVEKVEKIKQSQKKSKQEINDLFGVLMQKAFRGEIV